MATIYSAASWTGDYTYTRVKVDYDYSSTRATATLLYSRTNNYSGATHASDATFTFGDGSTKFTKSFYGKQTDAVVASLTFNYSVSGGTYSGSSTGAYLGGSWSVTIPQQMGSFNLNILMPDGTEPIGRAGSVEFSSNGGGSYTRVNNEPSGSYGVGTSIVCRNFTSGTGLHLSGTSGFNSNGGSGPWSVSQAASTTVSFQTAWNTYYRDINAWQPGATAQGGLLFDYYIYDRSGNLVNAYYNVSNEVANTVTREYGYTGKINNIRPNITGAHYTTNNVTNNGAGEFTWTYDNTNSIDLYSAWNTHTITIRRGTGIADITSPAWGWTNNYKTGTVTYGQSFNINVSLVTGYHWVNWTGSFTTSTQNYTFTIGDQNYDITANGAPNTYTIRYNANGGSGSMSDTGATYDSNVTLRANSFSRSGYSFAGWATSSGGGKVYNNQQTVSNLTATNGGVVTLYAVWTLNAPSNTTITINSSTRTKIYATVGCTGENITNYTIYYRVNGSSGDYSSLNLGTSTTGTITGLSPNTYYQIYATATNASGIANSSTTNTITMANTPKSINTSVSNTLPFSTDISVSATGDTNAPITNYTVYWCKKIDKDLKDMSIKYFDNAMWARVFYHQCNEGATLFTSLSEVLSTQTTDKYSRLNLLSDNSFKINGKFEFMLCYPNNNGYSTYNRWKQTNAPQNEYVARSSSGGKVTGYEAIHIDWTANYWGGLERFQENSSSFTTTYIDGSVGHGNWFYAIGAAATHGYGIPSYDSTSSNVELWVRIPDATVYSKTINTSTTTTIENLEEETTYMVWTQATNAGGAQTGKGIIFTTPADQAKIRIKQDGTWKKGKTYYKKDGQWVKAKKIYIKVNGKWKINNNYDS